MQAFLSIYSLIEWMLRCLSVAAQTFAVGGVTYYAFTLSPLKSEMKIETAELDRFCLRVLFWSASVLCVSQVLTSAALITFLVGSTGADLATAASADAVAFDLISAVAAFALAWAVRKPYFSAAAPPLLLSAVLVGAHGGLTHAASRAPPSLSLLAAEILHLVALAVWIGGAPYFVASLRMIGDRAERRFIARRFSFTSLASVAVLVSTGVLMAAPYTESLEGLYQTNYGLLLGTKVVLLLVMLCMGAANFLAIRGSRRDETASLGNVPVFAETETGIGLVAILCACALALSPLGANVKASRPDTAEISKHFELVWPRLATPAFAQLSAAKVGAAAAVQPLEPTQRNDADIAWSEVHHHYAGLAVMLMGVLALVAWSRRGPPVARHWPLLFFGFAIFLAIMSDEEVWPVGHLGFFESLATPQIAQHKLMIALFGIFAIFEWRVQLKKFSSAWPAYVFPLTVGAAAALLLTHYGHTDSKDEVLIEMSHAPVALLGVIAASARWLELRLPQPAASRFAGIVWPIAFTVAGALLLLYRETA